MFSTLLFKGDAGLHRRDIRKCCDVLSRADVLAPWLPWLLVAAAGVELAWTLSLLAMLLSTYLAYVARNLSRVGCNWVVLGTCVLRMRTWRAGDACTERVGSQG